MDLVSHASSQLASFIFTNMQIIVDIMQVLDNTGKQVRYYFPVFCCFTEQPWYIEGNAAI